MIPAHLTPLANHLWQSTLFAAALGLLSLAFRRQRAKVRYGLWLAASVKFLIPFAMLVSFGHQLEWRRAASIAHSPIPIAVEQISQPFVPPASWERRAAPTAESRVSAVLLGIWICGFAAVLFSWLVQWWRIGRPCERHRLWIWKSRCARCLPKYQWSQESSGFSGRYC